MNSRKLRKQQQLELLLEEIVMNTEMEHRIQDTLTIELITGQERESERERGETRG